MLDLAIIGGGPAGLTAGLVCVCVCGKVRKSVYYKYLYLIF